MQVNHANDYLVWDNVETLTFTLQRNTPITVTDVVGLPGITTATDLELNGIGVASKSITWAVPDILINPSGVDPRREIKRDDKFTSAESGKTFRVVSANLDEMQWDVVSVPDL